MKRLAMLALVLSACHCPSPFGLCAHDLYYMFLAIPFVPTWWQWVAERTKKFHFWKHSNDCAHHINGPKCDGHDHIRRNTVYGEITDVNALVCEEECESTSPLPLETGKQP